MSIGLSSLKTLKLSQQFGLLIGMVSLGFLVYGGFSVTSLRELQVNGPVYRQIVQGKDLIADILPPPEYIIESYLVTLQIERADKAEAIAPLVERLKVLKGDYDGRHQYWGKENLSSEMREAFLEKADSEAQRFYRIAFDEFIPAVQSRDAAKVEDAFGRMTSTYEAHRSHIDRTVSLANQFNTDTEGYANGRIETTYWLLAGIFFVSLGAAVFFAVVMTRSLRSQLGGEIFEVVGIAQRVATGDLDVEIDARERDSLMAAMGQVKTNLSRLIADVGRLAEAGVSGRLSVRADADQHSGSYRNVVQGVNDTLDAVTNPLNTAAQYLSRIAHGDIPAQITEAYQGDFNAIRENLNRLIENIQRLIADADTLHKAALAGRLEVRAGLEAHHGAYRDIVAGFNQTFDAMVEPIADVVRVLGALAKGDLNQTMPKHYQGTFGELARDVQVTTENLAGSVQVIMDATDAIQIAAREIAAGNADLADRTSQQAASLQETASTMEQFAATVRNSADNAKHANAMVTDASRVAREGGTKVNQLIQTMHNINDSANRIVDIISVIDGIAFQTNILALNAAVEAARAGEQGRGFAVVASEVRNLAQRSAAAAKEIKVLIGDSVNKVHEGAALVDEAGRNMEDIVTAVNRVTTIMAEITSATVEQHSGISQVNQAVTRIDETTQQNAALVEQASAAAESLEEQSNSLTEAVSYFKLDRARQRSPARLGHENPVRAALAHGF
jgi:methyl-accepting chemotaxis protein